jgi:hypothetical protein
LPDGPSRAFSGTNDAQALITSFTRRDQLPAETLPPDPIVAATVRDRFQAGSHDLVDGLEPVEIWEKATGKVVLKLWLHAEGDRLAAEFEGLDDRIGADAVRMLFVEAYLGMHCRDRWRDRIASITLTDRADAAVSQTFDYPRRK